jgi:hypothetical protein
MLTATCGPGPAAKRAPVRIARIAALRPTARVAQPGLVLVTVAIAAAPLVVTVIRSGEDLTIPVVVLCLTAGASLGWTVDDPAAEMLGPLPLDGHFRLRLRLAVAAALATLLVAFTAAVLEAVGPGLPDAPDRLAETATAAVVAVSVGLLAVRTGNRAVGAGAVTAGLLVPAVVAAFAVRWPATLPTFVTNSVHHRWWWLAAVGGALAVRLATAEPR